MAERREQEKPLSPFTPPLAVDKRYTPFAAEFISRRRHRCLKLCGCSTALFLILAVTVLILMITVLHIRDPTLSLNSVKIDGLDSLSNNTKSNLNLTLAAEISIKNPNSASFKFDESTTGVYYDGAVVGEVRVPEGEAAARKTRKINVFVDVKVDRIVGVSRFESDFVGGNFTLSVFTSLRGVVKIGGVEKRSLVVKLDCTMSVDLRSDDVRDLNCRRDVSL